MPANKGYLTAKTDKASDEYYTPDYAAKAIIEYIPREYKTIWCPFDDDSSAYVRLLRQRGYKVIASHIDNNQNFFYYEPEEDYDCIISNPPFSIKDDILQRLYELDKPYAILLPLPALQRQKSFQYLVGKQALIFDKRINFWKDKERTQMDKGAAFASIYLCYKFLVKDLVFSKLDTDE